MATEILTIENGTMIVPFYDENAGEWKHVPATSYARNRWDVTLCGRRIVVHTEAAGGFHKEFPLRDGTLSLCRKTTGRYAYFREEAFQAFLAKVGVTAVKGQNPNQTFYGDREVSTKGIQNFAVYTDGKMEEVETVAKTDYDHFHGFYVPYSWHVAVSVLEATFTIVAKKTDWGDSHSEVVTLYCVGNPARYEAKILEVLGGIPALQRIQNSLRG